MICPSLNDIFLFSPVKSTLTLLKLNADCNPVKSSPDSEYIESAINSYNPTIWALVTFFIADEKSRASANKDGVSGVCVK